MVTIADLQIISPDFEEGPLDDRFSKSGGNQAPRLRVSGVPDGTAQLAIICHDPDAPMPWGFTHWVVTGLPADTVEVDPAVGMAGPNDFGDTGYGGPQPPPGHGLHRYYFWVYALGTTVAGPISRLDFLRRHADDIIEQNRVVGTYETPA